MIAVKAMLYSRVAQEFGPLCFGFPFGMNWDEFCFPMGRRQNCVGVFGDVPWVFLEGSILRLQVTLWWFGVVALGPRFWGQPPRASQPIRAILADRSSFCGTREVEGGLGSGG